MKKNDWILIAITGLYSFLFYEQTAGINFTLFNIGLIAALLIKNSALIKNTNWKLAATGSILSALCIGYYGNELSVTANVISLGILSGLSFSANSSVVLSALFSFYSATSAIMFIFLDWAERKRREISSEVGFTWKKIILIAIPLVITLLFFFMYRASNPLFNSLAEKINLDFISWNWIIFTFAGFLMLYGFFYHKTIKPLSDWDENSASDLRPDDYQPISLFGKEFNINDEEFSGRILFILLNLLLLVVNGLDINFLFLDHQLPKGITHSQFVHQGINMLITSIIIAVLIILFYFRGGINFLQKSKTIKFLAYCWIAQNVFMLISTAARNEMYISDGGLTYKRIGVHFYLFLSAIGLLTTFIKIMKAKSNSYLFRTNGWLFYGVLIIASFINWDVLITNFNIHQAKWLEKNYLVKLSDENLPQLIMLQQDTSVNRRVIYLGKENDWEERENYEETNYSTPVNSFDVLLTSRLYDFMLHRVNAQWKSWYYEKSRIYTDLLALNANKKMKGFNFNPIDTIKTLEPFKEFNTISEINLGFNEFGKMDEFHYFPLLKKLDLSNNKLHLIKGLELSDQLEYLNLRGNNIYDYAPLKNMKMLKELIVSDKIADYQLKELQKMLPDTKIVKSS